jgi:putative SOS response-associated peptidase YedK
MINARAETLTELPSFKLLVDRHRCIIPADGFLSGAKKASARSRCGFISRAESRSGSLAYGTYGASRMGKRVESFTIITTEPNELLRPIHNRMPVILGQEDEEQWLDASRISFAKAKSLLKPYPEELMDAHDVSPVVNSTKYDGPECIQSVSEDDVPRGVQLSLL